ncbi:MAG: glutamate mutase L, partial [Oscillospiraceae bacterium]|nr:glutamate mutase L [Oscillospiraceae bacterium]
MNAVLLIDFGSTYTKLTAVDVEKEEILGTAASYTTVQTDINEGLEKALKILEDKIGKVEFSHTYACSSAAGGLRMVTSGLVPELTGEAAKLASLGAGAKVVGIYAFQLTEDDLVEIQNLKPDIFLLVGGTDGGNTECILHNARMLASIRPTFPIVVAGNRTAARECERILAHCEVHLCANVMPKFGVLKIEETQNKIREIFLNRIVQAKGLSKAADLLSDIMMPTPSAV